MDEGNRRLRDRRSGERGQVAILFALVFTFMFILFAFVVDFGHLINTKINLQIAADSAAYAGAAWQARQLNRIAAINYRMRQDLKEMVMRIQVTHLRHNRNYPRGSGVYNGNAAVPRGLYPFICQQAHGYVSISGVTYNPTTNLCRNASPETGGLPPIVVPPVIAAFDPFAVAIAAQIRQIQQASNRECRAGAEDNRVLAEHLIRVYTRRSQYHLNQIRAMEQWLNQVSQEDENSEHPVVRSAVESARKNLALANQDDFRFEVMQPRGNQYIRLEPIPLRATMFYVNYNVVGDGCVGRVGTIDFNDMLAGVFKEQSIVTYMAVKLSSRPKMLFMPAKWVESAFPELVAVAAAKPFGSRIGPDNTADPLIPAVNRPGNNNRMLNFSFRPQDNLGMLNTKLLAYFDALHPFNSASRPDGNQRSGWPDANRGNDLRVALSAIRAPTIFDALFYSIYPNPDNANDNLERFAQVLYPDYLEAAGPNNEIINTPDPATAAYLPQGVGSRNRGPGWVQINADNTGSGGPYAGYAEEDLSSHSIQSVAAAGLPVIPGKENEFGYATAPLIHSSWRPAGSEGRLGYSVKLVGFDLLKRTLRVREGASGNLVPISNPPNDSDFGGTVYH